MVSCLQWDYSGGTRSSNLQVVLDCRELVYAHENGEPQKGLHLFYSDLRPLRKLLTSHDVLGIPITLISVINSSVKKISKTSLGVSGMAVVGPTGELNDFTSTGFIVVVHTAGCDREPGGEVGGDDCGELWGEG